jgi:Flp pilus assembly protein TadG
VSRLRRALVRGRGEGGQALIEFALVAPIFFLILFGIIQLGLIFGGQNYLVSSVREMARYAAPYRVVDASGAATTCDTVADTLNSMLDDQALTADASDARTLITVTYDTQPEPGAASYYVEVTVAATFRFPLYVPIVAQFLDGTDGVLDNSLSLSAQEEMRVENESLASAFATPVSCTSP